MNPYSNTQSSNAPKKPRDPWASWNANRTPAGSAELLKAIDPIVTRAVNTFGDGSPASKSHAKILALNAADTFKPGGGAVFQTHVFNHLKGLQRFTAQAASPGRIPERVALDAMTLRSASQELSDDLDREPSDDELADHTGLPVKRIRYVRKSTPASLPGSFFDSDSESANSGMPAVERQSSLVRKLIFDDLSPVDQQIMDMALQSVPNQDIARRLRLSPGRVSQRKSAIQQMLDMADRGEL